MTTPNEKLIRNLTIKAGVMEMGEKIAWGSDTALMRQAAHALQVQQELLSSQAERIKELIDSVNFKHSKITELENERDTLRAQLADAELHTKQVERGLDKATAQLAEIDMINLPEPVAWFANYGGNVYTEAQLKQAVRDALDALKDVAQTLAWVQHGKCRGFSDGLLTTDEALDKARTALSKYKGGK